MKNQYDKPAIVGAILILLAYTYLLNANTSIILNFNGLVTCGIGFVLVYILCENCIASLKNVKTDINGIFAGNIGSFIKIIFLIITTLVVSHMSLSAYTMQLQAYDFSLILMPEIEYLTLLKFCWIVQAMMTILLVNRIINLPAEIYLNYKLNNLK